MEHIALNGDYEFLWGGQGIQQFSFYEAVDSWRITGIQHLVLGSTWDMDDIF